MNSLSVWTDWLAWVGIFGFAPYSLFQGHWHWRFCRNKISIDDRIDNAIGEDNVPNSKINLNVLDFKFHLNWSQSKGLDGIVLMTFLTMNANIERFCCNREVNCVIVGIIAEGMECNQFCCWLIIPHSIVYDCTRIFFIVTLFQMYLQLFRTSNRD